MSDFPRTTVGGVSVSRLIVGTNWFLGYSHTSAAKDRFIQSYQTRKNIADVLEVFFNAGVDTVMCPASELMRDAVAEAEQRTGRKGIMVLTPSVDVLGDGAPAEQPEAVFDTCRSLGGTFCFPHQSTTDAILDRLHREIRHFDRLAKLIREREMVPGLSTHAPEAVTIADESGADVETYIQLYNAAGFLMQVEVDWVMRIIRNAKKPVMTIKPLAAGQLLPPVGLAFAWSTIREQDMVTLGTTTPDEAREGIDLSLDYIAKRIPDHELQRTRSKKALEART